MHEVATWTGALVHWGLPRLGPLLMAVSTVCPVPGQTVTGRVVERPTGRGLQMVAIELLDSAGNSQASALTEEGGGFRLTTPRSGHYTMVVASMGYERLRTRPFKLENDSVFVIEVPLSPSPIPIPGVRAQVERVRTHTYLELQGFYRRRDRGLGRFFTPEEIEAIDPARYVDLLSRAPGIYFSHDGYLGEGLLCGNFGDYAGGMIPRVFIDGAMVEFPGIRGAGSPVQLDTVVPIQDVSAIEVYRRRSEVPVEFSATRGWSSSSCVVLIWTKGGR